MRSKYGQLALPLDEGGFPSIGGLSGTFSSSKTAPLHSWFPYLEGYSPDFVEGIRSRYMPAAKKVIDPFAGSGTSPLVLASMGVECGYCEVNPVMQVVIATKLRVAALDKTQRSLLRHGIDELAEDLVGKISSCEPDVALARTYDTCFAPSVFFDAVTFESILRSRTFCDKLAKKNELLSKVLELTVLSNIVTCSRLKRAGDVRYKTEKELRTGIPALIPSAVFQLRMMATDCIDCPYTLATPRLLAPDAKSLRAIPKFYAEGVITSPPYLNGTNYIRNTKLELWFLRQIQGRDGLRAIRDQVVTAGINDVTKRKGLRGVTPRIVELLNNLEATAYDKRIPKMVAAYFEDMLCVFLGLHAQTRLGAVICVDIGDSRYGGIHVNTQDLLVDVAECAGLALQDKVHLRTRISKDRTELSQDLLVFERISECGNHKQPINSGDDSWQKRWRLFKDSLPHQRPPYSARNWGHARHSVCSFQGKMKPSLASFLVDSFTRPGDLVLDPFSGAGTIPFEAALNGRHAFAFDISLMAFAVTSAKLRPPASSRLEKMIARLASVIDNHKTTDQEIQELSSLKFNQTIPDYFHPKTLGEILAAREFFRISRDDTPEWCFLLACMLHILHGNRPYALSRRSHPITPYAPTGPIEYRPVMEKLVKKVRLVLASELSRSFAGGFCYMSDILEEWPANIDKLDAIITSPPFFDSQRFYMTNWMRYWFCGWSRDDFSREPSRFIESLQKKSLEIYRPILQQCKRRLKEKGVIVMHVGRSHKCDMARGLAQIAAENFNVYDIVDETVEHCEKHGVRDKGTVTSHQYLVLDQG